MEGGFWVVIGMSIAYAASFLGMTLAYLSWRRRKKQPEEGGPGGPAAGEEKE